KRGAHQRVEQFLEDDLTRYGLGDFENSREIQGVDRGLDRARRTGEWPVVSGGRVEGIELLYLPVGAPPGGAIPGAAQIGMRARLEPMNGVEARGEFVGERLVVDKAVGAGGTDGLFVEAHRVEHTAFNPGDLRADQRGAVLEILGTMLCPDLEPPVMS